MDVSYFLFSLVCTACHLIGKLPHAIAFSNEVDSTRLFGRSEKEYLYVRNKIEEIEGEILNKYSVDKTKLDDVSKAEALEFSQDGRIGDILLTWRDIEKWYPSVNKRVKRKIYNFENYPSRKWSLPIKYMIDKITIKNASNHDIIRQAIAGWEKETCIRFKEIEEDISEQFLYFTNMTGKGCNSYIGKATFYDMDKDFQDELLRLHHTQRQPIHLGYGCYTAVGTIMHEIGHALGLYHEAQRLDRDDYIAVLTSNVKAADLSNFIQPEDHTTIETKGVPYDLGSLMHYAAVDFSIDEDKYATILPYQAEKLFVMGQRTEIGFYDAKIINMAYCPVYSHLGCKNGGYTDPNDHNRCKCTTGWGGRLCNEIKQGVEGCSPLSGHLNHTSSDVGKKFSLFSPNYKNTRNWMYKLGDECYWIIQVPQEYQIAWWIDSESDQSGTGVYFGLIALRTGCQTWLEITKPGEDRGMRVCSVFNDTIPAPYNWTQPQLSHTHELYISFQSFEGFYIEIPDSMMRGFEFKYELRRYTKAPPTTLSPLLEKYKNGDNYDYDYNYDWLHYLIRTTKRTPYWWEQYHTTRKPYYYWQRTSKTAKSQTIWWERTTPPSHFKNEYQHDNYDNESDSTGKIIGGSFGAGIGILALVIIVIASIARVHKIKRRNNGLIQNEVLPSTNTTTPSQPTSPSTSNRSTILGSVDRNPNNNTRHQANASCSEIVIIAATRHPRKLNRLQVLNASNLNRQQCPSSNTFLVLPPSQRNCPPHNQSRHTAVLPQSPGTDIRQYQPTSVPPPYTVSIGQESNDLPPPYQEQPNSYLISASATDNDIPPPPYEYSSPSESTANDMPPLTTTNPADAVSVPSQG